MTLYYESHVTIEPVFDARLDEATQLAQAHRFKIANLLMQKRSSDQPERSKYDTFMTAHSQSSIELTVRMKELIVELKEKGFKVWRYKIESVPMDSKVIDVFDLLDE